MPADPQPRRQFQFSLWTLLLLVTLTGPIVFLIYSCTRPQYVSQRIDCGDGRYIEILRQNEFCGKGEWVYYRFPGMTNWDNPVQFSTWNCGSDPELRVWKSDDGEIAGIAYEGSAGALKILVDFESGESWPANPSAVEEMLDQLRAKNGALRLDPE
jgi:hypothetical protein